MDKFSVFYSNTIYSADKEFPFHYFPFKKMKKMRKKAKRKEKKYLRFCSNIDR